MISDLVSSDQTSSFADKIHPRGVWECIYENVGERGMHTLHLKFIRHLLVNEYHELSRVLFFGSQNMVTLL